jgi:tetratricopeptide (TPR) repeat protein
MANKYLGRESKALDFYNKIPPGNAYYENAQWEKAQILKSQKKIDQAILALQEVVKFNGSLKTRAENLIKELKAPTKH